MGDIKPIICDKLRNIHTVLTRVSNTFKRMSNTSRSDVENDSEVLNKIADSLEKLNSESNLNKSEMKLYKKHNRGATFACTKKSDKIFNLAEHIYEKLEVMNLLSGLLLETESEPVLQTALKKIDSQLETLKRRVDTLQDPDKRRTPTKTASSYSSKRSRRSTNTRRRRAFAEKSEGRVSNGRRTRRG